MEYLSRTPMSDAYAYEELMVKAYRAPYSSLDERFYPSNMSNLIYSEANFTHVRHLGRTEDILVKTRNNVVEAISQLYSFSTNLEEKQELERILNLVASANNSTELMGVINPLVYWLRALRNAECPQSY